MIGSIANNNIGMPLPKTGSEWMDTIQWKAGNIIEAILLDQNDQDIVIEVEGKAVEAKTTTPISREIGEDILFEVKDLSDGKLLLKPYAQEENIVHGVKQYDDLRSILKNEDILINEEHLETAQMMVDNGLEIEKETFEKIVQAKKQIEQMVNRMTRDSAERFIESPYSMDKATIDVIARFLQGEQQENIPVTKKQIQQECEKYQKDHQSQTVSTQILEKSVKALLKEALPITAKNIQSLISINRKVETIVKLDENAIAECIRKNSSFTIEQLYASKFSGGKTKGIYSGSNPYENTGMADQNMDPVLFAEQVKKLLNQQQIPIETETIEAAKLLVKQELPVDKNNIEKVLALQKTMNHIDLDQILQQAAHAIKENKNPGQISLDLSENREVGLSQEEITQIVEDIPKMDIDIIEKVLIKNLPINIKNLQKMLHQETDKEPSSEQKEEHQEQNLITIKRQMEEIRLKMTVEAAVKLNDKISIDTAPLQDVVKELRELESQVYKDHLQQAGVEPTEENTQKMDELYQKIEVVKGRSDETLCKVMQNQIPLVIDDLYEEELKGQMALNRYEELGTQPERRFGDSITKVVDQIEPLLEQQEIEPSEKNIRAARILIQNQIPVNEENINHLKLLDEKVNGVTTKLHPLIAASMIKDGLQPDEMHIDEILEYIASFKESLGEDITANRSEIILEMDDRGQLGEKERQGMVAIYRMLHSVEKTDGKVIGWLMKNDMKLTLNNLLEASKYFGRTGAARKDIDVKIDNDFGMIEKLMINEKSIRSQLEEALSKNNMAATEQNMQKANDLLENDLSVDSKGMGKMAYLQEVLGQWMEKASPKQVEQWMQKYPDWQNMNLEQLLEQTAEERDLSSDGDNQKQAQKLLEEIRGLQTTKKETLTFMEKNQIPMTLNNLRVVSQMMNNSFLFGEELHDLDRLLKESQSHHKILTKGLEELKNGRNIEDVLEEIEQKVKEAKRELMDVSPNQKQSGWKSANDLEKMITVQKQVQKNDMLYQIPIQLHDRVTNMNLYILKDKQGKEKFSEKDISAFISIKTETMGNVQMYIKITDLSVNFQINGENEQVTSYLRSEGQFLQKAIEEVGYHVAKGQYGQEKPKNPMKDEISWPKGLSSRKLSEEGFEVII